MLCGGNARMSICTHYWISLAAKLDPAAKFHLLEVTKKRIIAEVHAKLQIWFKRACQYTDRASLTRFFPP